MDFAHAKQETNGLIALTAAVFQLLLLIGLGFAASAAVSAGVRLASGGVSGEPPANQESRLSAPARDSTLPFSAELCSAALPGFSRPSPCDPPK